jgi:hypothetical protein
MDCDIMTHNVRTFKIKVGDSLIELLDYTHEYKKYNVVSLIVKYIQTVPEEDLKGLSVISIFDRTPRHFPQHKAGGYSPLGNRGATIDIFLSDALGHMTYPAERQDILSVIKNKLFLILFGKFFIIETLFHEIAHHKYTIISPREYKTAEATEEDAKKYTNDLLGSTFPFLGHYYDLLNRAYKYLYRQRIERSDKISSDIPPHYPEYFDYQAKLYMDHMEYENAMAAFDQLIKSNSHYPDAYFNRGVAKGHLERYQEAIEDFTMAITVDPRNPISYYNRGYCQHQLANYEKAIEDYTISVNLKNLNYDVYLNRSKCYEALNNMENAASDYKEAIKRGYKAECEEQKCLEGLSESCETRGNRRARS